MVNPATKGINNLPFTQWMGLVFGTHLGNSREKRMSALVRGHGTRYTPPFFGV